MIFIAGGAGFIGSNAANYFLRKGERVTIYDNMSRLNVELNARWLRDLHGDNVTLVRGDVRDPEGLRRAAEGAEVVLNCAAQVAVTASLGDPTADFEVNARGTLNLLELARGLRTDPIFVFASTNKCYGENVNAIPVSEEESRYSFADEKFVDGIPEGFSVDQTGHSPYGCSKLAADLYVQDYARTYGLRTVVFRLSCVYGPRQFGNEDQGWVCHFVASALLGRPLTIYGSGKQVRDILYVDDLVEAFDSVLRSISTSRGNVFNMGGGPENTVSLLELIEHLEKLLGRKVPHSFSEWRPEDQKVYYSDIRKARRVLGWSPRVGKWDGVGRLLSWVQGSLPVFESMYACASTTGQ
jgi:CDP-paratose 2-epimerase